MSNHQHNFNRLMDNRSPVKYADQEGKHEGRNTTPGSCFIGGGLPKSSYRRMSSQARFSTIDVFIRTFTSKVPKARNKNDMPRYKIDISNAKREGVSKLSRSDREFYNNRITQN